MLQVQHDGAMDKLESEVDADIEAFDVWFRSLGNDALVRSEKATLKTYLWWKVRGGKKDGEETSR